MIRGLCFLLTIAALAAALPAQAQTQNWPSRFVRLVVPGGSGTAAFSRTSPGDRIVSSRGSTPASTVSQESGVDTGP